MKKIILFALFIFLLNTCSESTTEQPPNKNRIEKTTTDLSPKSSEIFSKEKNKTPKASPKKEDRLPMREEMQNKLERMHEHLIGQMEKGIDPKGVKTYMKECNQYMTLYGDSLAAEHMFSAAELALAVQDYTAALDNWRNVYQAYKTENHPKVPHSIFMVGYTYENVLDKKDLAKRMYKKLLREHPNHELVKDVIEILKNIDKSPEDLIKEFQRKKGTG